MMRFSARDQRKRYSRMTKASEVGKTVGRWTQTEHMRFIQAIKRYGRSWRVIERHVGSRTAQQIRSHAQKFFSRIEHKYGQLPEADVIAKLEEISSDSDSEAYMSETGA